MNEENVSVKISMPLIDDIELQKIDTFYNDIVSEYTKAFVKEKEQVITQRLMMNLQQENVELKENYKAILKQRDDTNKSAVETIEKYQQENARLKETLKKITNYIKEHDCDYIYLDCKFLETQIYNDLLQMLNKLKEN